MTSTVQEYSVDQEIIDFFRKTTATRSECDAAAKDLVGGDVIPVDVQGVCSYTVYAGPKQEFVVQFRLRSLSLKPETAALAREIHGDLTPEISFKGQIGADFDVNGREPLNIYVMTRIKGVSRLDFILAHEEPENSLEYFSWRKTLITDVASFFAAAWKKPQAVDQSYKNAMRSTYERELQLLLASMPDRFHSVIKQSLDTLPAIFSLPMVLLHKDFGDCNIMVDPKTCHLVGVIDWAEAEIGPFGTNFHSLQPLMSKLHLRDGWIRYHNYDALQETFWRVFSDEAGGLDRDTVRAIKSARVVGLLRSRGFTSRLANAPEPVPIRDDESGAYNMMILDGLLLNPVTSFMD